MKDALLRILAYPKPIRAVLAKKLIQRLSLFSYRDRLKINAVDRPHYGHCIFEAARLASHLKYPRISVIEFGCGGGNGLVIAEKHIAEVSKLFPVEIELYGFDSGAGMPAAKDYRDFPHYFNRGLYRMDPGALRQKLKLAQLVLGDVLETCRRFIVDYKPAPVGCVFHDLDFYSSTRDALTLFDADAGAFMPRIHMYFDDIKGTHAWASSEFAGELLAIEEFNAAHAFKKIAISRSMRSFYPDQWWADQIYIYHDFQHPDYNVFIAGEEQVRHESEIKLR